MNRWWSITINCSTIICVYNVKWTSFWWQRMRVVNSCCIKIAKIFNVTGIVWKCFVLFFFLLLLYFNLYCDDESNFSYNCIVCVCVLFYLLHCGKELRYLMSEHYIRTLDCRLQKRGKNEIICDATKMIWEIQKRIWMFICAMYLAIPF